MLIMALRAAVVGGKGIAWLIRGSIGRDSPAGQCLRQTNVMFGPSYNVMLLEGSVGNKLCASLGRTLLTV